MTSSHPKRLQPPSPPGDLLKGITMPPRRTRAAARQDDPDYLALIRQLPCLYCGVEPCGESAHVKSAGASFGKPLRFGKRPDDKWALPLCRDDHLNARHAQHRHSEQSFWDAIGIAPLPLCDQLYKQRGDLVAMRAVVMVAIACRSKT